MDVFLNLTRCHSPKDVSYKTHIICASPAASPKRVNGPVEHTMLVLGHLLPHLGMKSTHCMLVQYQQGAIMAGAIDICSIRTTKSSSEEVQEDGCLKN